jgi:hypothetical protein
VKLSARQEEPCQGELTVIMKATTEREAARQAQEKYRDHRVVSVKAGRTLRAED